VNVSLRRISVTTIALLALLALTAPAAFAQYPPGRGLALACERSGNQVVCVLAGAEANDACTATATQGGETTDSVEFTTSSEGTAEFTLALTDSSAATVGVTCEESGSETDTVAAAQVTTPTTAPGTPVPAGRTLAMTGLEISGLLALAVGLIGAGAIALRRRETAGA
jgi:hypothetical protein